MLPSLGLSKTPAQLEAMKSSLRVEIVLLCHSGEGTEAEELLNLGQLLPRSQRQIVGIENLSG